MRRWTFGQKIGAGFAVVVLLSALIAGLGILGLRTVVESKDRVISGTAENLRDANLLRLAREEKANAARGFLLTRDERYLDKLQLARGEFAARLADLRGAVTADEGRRLLGEIERAEGEHQAAIERAIALRRTDAGIVEVGKYFEDEVGPHRGRLDAAVTSFQARQQRLLDESTAASGKTAGDASSAVLALGFVVVLLAVGIAVVLTRGLSKQIGSAVGHVQSSSSELQAAASQQATGAREQSTAMSEITTTISELLATSRQIAESAQRVAKIAEQTAGGARAGSGTVERASESIAGIRRQVDQIVVHMLELGKKSQQIGAVVEIVSELAEQTNILAINATIEAAGAGEAGKRFAMVAEEIRRLADRVSGSTKEIRGLVEDVRGAVNTTVMATESGSKAVDAGTRQFSDVSSSFAQIAALVSTTTDAAREIELSTKQQATAVEQVSSAAANVAQATKETEASSNQVLQTAGVLATISRELLELTSPRASA